MALKKVKLGSYHIAEGWNEVTLKQWSQYVRYISEQEEKEEELDYFKILQLFSDIPKETMLQMPIQLFEDMFKHLEFLNDDISEKEASDRVEIDGETYLINHMESMKVQEYLDMTRSLEADKYNYPMILAILCRKKDETYDDRFIADRLDERIKMYESLTVDKAFPLIAFFFVLRAKYGILSQNSSQIPLIKRNLTELVRSIRHWLGIGRFITPSKRKANSTLRKLEKSIRCI